MLHQPEQLEENTDEGIYEVLEFIDRLSDGLTDEQIHERMNSEKLEFVTQLLAQEDWHLKGKVGLYQDYEKTYLWNVYDNEPNSRPTPWAFNNQTNRLQKRT